MVREYRIANGVFKPQGPCSCSDAAEGCRATAITVPCVGNGRCGTFERAPFRSCFRVMEQSCYKCGHVMEEGRPFCPYCAAPQIRVVISEPLPAAAQATAVPQTTASLPASQTVPVLAVPMHWSQAIKPCALAAVVASVLMGLGLNPFVAMLVVGFLCVVFYRQSHPGVSITAGTGARLGALSGLLWFAMSSILEAIVVLVLRKGPELRQALVTALDQAVSRTNDPQVLALVARAKTPEGLEFLMVFGLICALLSAIVLASIGGAVGGSIFGRYKKD